MVSLPPKKTPKVCWPCGVDLALRNAYEKEVEGPTIKPRIAAEDGVSLYYENECFTEIFASRIAAAAFYVKTRCATKIGNS